MTDQQEKLPSATSVTKACLFLSMKGEIIILLKIQCKDICTTRKRMSNKKYWNVYQQRKQLNNK